MLPLSVVIITRNEESNIGDCILSAKRVSNNIIVVDCGSYDHTIEIAKQHNAHTICTTWKNFGHSRNIGAKAAVHNWILALDADERIADELVVALHEVDFNLPKPYRLKRKNYLGNKLIRFGTIGFDWPTKLYNKTNAYWDASPIHEELICSLEKKCYLKKGFIKHNAFKDIITYQKKLDDYAQLCALRYFLKKKKATWLKRFLSPVFNSLKSYIFLLGFLDGIKGWELTRLIFRYTSKKYNLLHQLSEKKDKLIAGLPASVKASA